MIVYNVNRAWFSLKNDAETYRRNEKLPVEATAKIEINDRDQLAALLNGLCGITPPEAVAEVVPVPVEVVARARVRDDADIPLFLRKSWARHFGEPEPTS